MAGALIGALRVSLSAETSAFEAGMKRSQKTAQSTAQKIKNSFGSLGGEFGLLKSGVQGFIGALSVGAVIAAGKAALEYAGSLGETAQQLGVTTRELQTFRFAAQQNGASLEEADQALGKFAVSISKAQAGSKQATAAFNAVGVSLADLQSKSKSELLGQIADKMKATGGAANNAAAGVAIFGRGFLKIVPTLDQGSAGMNELARAAEELGIVLSDSQIQKADETADKIDALQTVLKAQIAGVVADNADSILDLANAIAEVAREAAAAIGKLRAFYDEARIAANQAEIWLSKRFDAGLLGTLGIGNQNRAANQAAAQADINAIRKRQGDARFGGLFQGGRPKPSGGGGNPNRFLAGGGGSHKPKKDHSAEEALRKQIDALRDQNQFDQDIRRANIDILQAKKDLATDAVERYQISIDTKDAEDAAFRAQLAYEVKLNELTKGQDGISAAQAQELQLKHDQVSQLERNLLRQEEDERARKASAEINLEDLQLERDRLQSQSQLAKTAKQQREIQLKILDNAYKIEKAQLEEIIASRDATEAQKEIARRRLANLNKTYSNDRQGVIDQTRNPMEQWAASIPQTSDEIIEALQSIEAEGLDHLSDALTDVIMGTKNLKEAFHEVAASVLADLLKMAIKMALLKGLSALFGGGFAGGGYTGDGIGGYGTYAGLVNSGAIPANGAFASGGYTGNRGVNSIAGVVHGREFVINAQATRKYLPLLEAMNSGRLPGMKMGGLAGLPLPRMSYAQRASISNDNGSGFTPVQHNHFDLRGAVMTEDLLRQMNDMSKQAADSGARMGVQRMVDLNERTFGKALGRR